MKIEVDAKERKVVALRFGNNVYLPFNDGAACIELSPDEGVSIVSESLEGLSRDWNSATKLYPGDSITLNL